MSDDAGKARRGPALAVMISTASVFVALVLVAMTSLFSPMLHEDGSPTVRDYLARSRIADKQKLSIGVPAGLPLLGYRDDSGELTGFDIELARSLAEWLGFTSERIEFVPVDSADRVKALMEGHVDLVVASFSMTEDRKRYVSFAGPYLQTRQAILTRVKTGPQPAPTSVDQLSELRICVIDGSTSELNFLRYDVKVEVQPSARECQNGVDGGQYDAFSSDQLILAGFAYNSGHRLRVTELPFAETDDYGIGVAKDDPYLKALVEHFLLKSYEDGQSGAWQKAFDRTLGPAGISASQPRPQGKLLSDSSDHAFAPSWSSPEERAPLRAVRRARRYRHATVPGRRARPRPRPQPDPEAAEAASAPGGVSWQGAWSLVVGVPVTVSALYLWIQSGGDRQFTLLLAESVNPINFFATMMLSTIWVFSAVPALVFAVGGLVLGSAVDEEDRKRLAQRYLLVRWTGLARPWLKLASFIAAAVCSPVLFLPAWLLAAAVAFQARLFRPGRSRAAWFVLVAVLAVVVPLGATIVDLAVEQDQPLLAAMLAWPVLLLTLGADGPIQRKLVPAFIQAGLLLAVVLGAGVVYNLVTTPLLPLTVVNVAPPGSETASRSLRGYIVSVDEAATTVLLEGGGVEIVANEEIHSRISCPSSRDLPSDSPRLYGLPVRESLLKRLARSQRPAAPQDPRCRQPGPGFNQ